MAHPAPPGTTPPELDKTFEAESLQDLNRLESFRVHKNKMEIKNEQDMPN